MIEHSRITSGYDYEILMGGEYFLAVMQATYYAGDLPRNVTFGGVTVLFESPSAVEVLPLGSATDLTVTVPYSAAGVDGEVLLQITLTTDKRDAAIEITSAFVGLDEATESILTSLGVLDEARDFLRTALDRTFTIKGGEVPVWQVVSRRVPADGDYQAAWGLYVNKEYFTSPHQARPKRKMISFPVATWPLHSPFCRATPRSSWVRPPRRIVGWQPTSGIRGLRRIPMAACGFSPMEAYAILWMVPPASIDP